MTVDISSTTYRDADVIYTGNSAIVIDEDNNFIIHKENGDIIKNYRYGLEVFKGIFVFYTEDGNYCHILNDNLDLIEEVDIDKIVISLASLLEKLGYDEIMDTVDNFTTRLTADYINSRDIFYDSIDLKVTFERVWEIKNANYKILRVEDILTHIDSAYKNGKLDIPFFKYSADGQKIIPVDDIVRIIKIRNNRYLYDNQLYIGNQFMGIIGDCKFIKRTTEFADYLIVKENSYEILRLAKGDKMGILKCTAYYDI